MPFIRRDGLGVEVRDIGLLLPHEMWAAMYEFQHDAWVSIFGDPTQWSEFWSRSPWLEDHPGHDVADAVPLRLHGDDAQHKKGLTGLAVMVLSWGSPLSCFAAAIDSLLLIMAMPLLLHTEETLQMMYAIIAWSFNIIAEGVWPDRDHKGQPWTSANPQRRAKQGQELANGILGFIVEVLGDWKWIKETFKLRQHFNTMDCCHQYFARKAPGILNFARFAPTAFAQRPRRSMQSYVDAFLPAPPPLARIIGFHIIMLLVDFMHSDHLGVSQWSLANCLLELVAQGIFGRSTGDFQSRTNRLLRRAWLEFKEWAKGAGRKHSQRTFTCAQLSVGGGANNWPEFKGKAHNCSVVVRWLNHVVGTQPNHAPRQQVRAKLLSSHVAVYDIMEAGGIWLDDPRHLLHHGENLLMAYGVLSREAHLSGLPGWQLKPKHHHIAEGLHWAANTGRNPRSAWCYKHEDMVGRAARTAARTHPSTTSIVTLERWQLRWALRGNRDHRPLILRRRKRWTRNAL